MFIVRTAITATTTTKHTKRLYAPGKEAQQLVVRGHGEGGGVAETGIAQAVHHRGEHILKPEKLHE